MVEIMHHFPCLHCHPRTYITMVQSLIERCLLLRMDREQCVKALADHARIHPRVTQTVWKELVKENKDFFLLYFRSMYPSPSPSPSPCRNTHFQRPSRFTRRNHNHE